VPCDGTVLGPAVAGGNSFDGSAQTAQVHPSATQICSLLSEIGPNGFHIITHTAGVAPTISALKTGVKPELLRCITNQKQTFY
jgi:hypothetical protein